MAAADEPAPAASRLDVRALLQAQAASSTRPSVVVDKEDDLQYDLGHLCAFDPTPVDAEALREDGEGHLLRTARDNMQLLTNKLYGLLANAQEKSVIRLPPPVTQLPREKPLPEARQLTRWEKFAKEKGIVKHKRSKMVWDEVSGPTSAADVYPTCLCVTLVLLQAALMLARPRRRTSKFGRRGTASGVLTTLRTKCRRVTQSVGRARTAEPRSEPLASPAGLGHRGQARRRPERGPLRGAVGRPQGEANEAKGAAREEPSRGVARGGRLEQGRRCGHR